MQNTMNEKDVDVLIDHVIRSSSDGSGRKYIDASDEVISVAGELIESCEELAIAREARIKFLFVRGKWSKWGECAKATGKWRHLTGFDYVISIHKEAWESFDIKQKKALMHHELCHIMRTPKGKWAIANHDVEEFFSTVERFGPWRDELSFFQKALAGDIEDIEDEMVGGEENK